jgi:prepilin-type processing-associated H-X9-DG protein
MAMLTYMNDSDQAYPLCIYKDLTPATATDGPKITFSTFEFLASWSDGELTKKLFQCPSNAGCKPDADAVDITGYTGAPAWTNATLCAFAYDWAAPGSAKANRVLLADRPKSQEETIHRRSMNAVFADGHVGSLNKISGGGDTYCSEDISKKVGYQIENTDAKGKNGEVDNIYDNTSDGGNTVAKGKGSTTRAFVR